ncbi:MAG: alpha/beta hydrolase [bacterium]|nr:alpha/beta hydrolase [bacterium]
MQKRVFIIHMWDSHPKDGWYPWLQKELEGKGFQVQVPAMPEPAKPNIENWVSRLAKIVGNVDENTFFVGHSVGCQTILRYFENLPADKKVGGAVFVAGWLKLVNLETEEEKEIAKPWLETPIDFNNIKQHTTKFVAIFSDNDQWVSIDNKALFEQKLGAKTIIENQKGHISGDEGIAELPSALESIVSFSDLNL